MRRGEFQNMIEDVFVYFGKKPPSGRQVDLWFDECQFIPTDAKGGIYDNFKKKEDLPRNIPKAFLEGWSIWKKQNPSRIAHVKTECPECDWSSGFVSYSLNGHRYVSLCPICENWKESMGKNAVDLLLSITRERIREMGGRCLWDRKKRVAPADTVPF